MAVRSRRSWSMLLLALLCAHAWSAPFALEGVSPPPARPACETPNAWGCAAEAVEAAPVATLRAAGPTISVSCGQRAAESPVDAAYMQHCVEDMRRLAMRLSAKWAPALTTIDPGQIRYDWNKAFGCVDVVSVGGSGSGLCPTYGEARIPLSWRNAE